MIMLCRRPRPPPPPTPRSALAAQGQLRAQAVCALCGARDLGLHETEGHDVIAPLGQFDRDRLTQPKRAAADDDGFHGTHSAKLAGPASWRPNKVSQSALFM